jgi:hypothetical protein
MRQAESRCLQTWQAMSGWRWFVSGIGRRRSWRGLWKGAVGQGRKGSGASLASGHVRWSRRGRWQQPCSRTAIGGFGRQKKIAVLAWLWQRRGSDQLESAPNDVCCKLIDVRQERWCWTGGEGKERDRKGRDESMQRHTRQVMHLSPRQGNGVGCAIIVISTEALVSLVCSRPRAETRGLAPVRAERTYGTFSTCRRPAQPCRKPRCRASFAGKPFFRACPRESQQSTE